MDPPFAVWDAEDPKGFDSWVSHWESWPGREVYAHPHYVRLFSDKACRALCAAWRSDRGCVLYPFLFRDIAAEPFCGEAPIHAFDIVTPYGYGGPFRWGEGDPDDLADRFWSAFSEWAARQPVVSEFIRFTLFPEDVLRYPGEREEKLTNVVRSLDIDGERIWMEYEHKVRKNVNMARRSGVRVEVDLSGERLDEFLKIYSGTMDRRQASRGYYFPSRFFETLRDALPGQFAYFHALHEGKVVSTELVLVSAESVYSFLGGTDGGGFDLRPNDLLKHEIILWAAKNCKQRFVLGGGYLPDDGIFRYKKSFSPSGCVPFHVGRRVLDRELYATLMERKRRWARSGGREWEPRHGYFPEYRA